MPVIVGQMEPESKAIQTLHSSKYFQYVIKYIFEWNDYFSLRQYKNESIQSKNIPILKLPHFLPTYTVRQKARQFQK